MKVNFRFGERSGRLENVLMEAIRDIDKRPGDFERIQALMVEKYGRPWAGSTAEEQTARWTFESTTIELQSVQLKVITFRNLTILYRPREMNPPI